MAKTSLIVKAGCPPKYSSLGQSAAAVAAVDLGSDAFFWHLPSYAIRELAHKGELTWCHQSQLVEILEISSLETRN